MLEHVKILTSRRAYQFNPDDLRLSMLSVKPVQDQIQQLFSFQTATVGTPMPTFGDVPLTIPPGLVFTSGVWVSTGDNQLVPIRFLNIEQNRIVIDVAGVSSVTQAIFDRLVNFLSDLKAQDGTPIVGEPAQILDYSEITAHFSKTLSVLFAQPVSELFQRLANHEVHENMLLVPTFAVQAYSANQPLAAVPGANDSRVFTFAQRAGTRPEEHMYFSGAPLDSEAHLNYLNELEAILASL